MKRLLYLAAALLVICSLSGCTGQVPANMSNFTFYYLQNELEYGDENPVIAEFVRTVPTSYSFEDIIRLYFNGPNTYDCLSPFPGGIELLEMYTDGNRATLVISPHLSTLSPSKQTIACACLTKTIIGLTGVTSVQIKIENGLINGETTVTFSEESFAYLDSMTQEDMTQQVDHP